MSEVLNKFVDYGTDMRTTACIDSNDEDLLKSMHRSGLVQVQRVVNSKHGQYTRMQWVKPSEGASIVMNALERKYGEPRDNKGNKIEFKFLLLNNPSQSYSLSEVLKKYNESGTRLPLQSFIEKNYFISNGRTQTKDCYCRRGEYTPDRQRLHNSIISKIVEQAGKPKEGEKPVCILLGGGSASGKSTIRKMMIQPDLDDNGIKVGMVDSDDIKEDLPEYELFKEQDINSAAFRVHQESSDIVDEAIDTLIYEKRHFIYDGTMKNLEKYKKIIRNLKDAGYEVRVVGADIPLKDALERSESRARKEGRNVPRSIVEGSHRGFAAHFSEIAELADDYEIYDNSGEFPVLMKDKSSGVQDERLWNRFLEKGKTKSGGDKNE